MKAKDILKNNETAVVIFTVGLNLEISEKGTSKSGVWKIKENLLINKVIVYRRNKSKRINEIFIGDYGGLSPSQVKGLENRFVIEFNNAEFAGVTDENWNGFTETKRGAASPIRYIK